MPDRLRTFSDIVLSATKGIDYDIRVREAGGYVTVAAIHGGSIEPLTSEIARAVAGQDYNLYDFRGLRAGRNDELRVSPLRYDEARLLALVARSKTVLSIAGVADVGMTLQVGGANATLRNVLLEALVRSGFDSRPSATPGIGSSPAFFFNRAEKGGVQIELSQALRASLIDCPLHACQWEDPTSWNDRMHLLVQTIREAMDLYVSGDRVDLAETLERFERTTRLIPKWMRHAQHDEDG